MSAADSGRGSFGSLTSQVKGVSVVSTALHQLHRASEERGPDRAVYSGPQVMSLYCPKGTEPVVSTL